MDRTRTQPEETSSIAGDTDTRLQPGTGHGDSSGDEEASAWKREVVVGAAGIKQESAHCWQGSCILPTFSSGWERTGINEHLNSSNFYQGLNLHK